VGTVIALCAVLLLKWLAVVALVAGGLVVLARWLWRRRYVPLALGLEPAAPREAEHGLVRLPAPRPEGPDCTWCGLAGGHHDALGRELRPRYAHQARAVGEQRVRL
jgi:cobalamin synthase